jgi:putative ABC transport system substrate-binding protein
MKRREFCRALATVPIATPFATSAQSARPSRVAWVSTDQKNSPSQNLPAFRGGMCDLGYVEGRDLVIDAWWGEGSGERVEQMAPDIVRARPDVVVAAGGLALDGLMRAGVNLPTMFSISADPVEAKVAKSFAHPGGNRTGISLFTLALVGKKMEFLKEAVPGAKRVAVIANPQHPGEQQELAASKTAAAKLGLTVRYFPVYSEAELEAALADIARARDDAIIAFADGFTMGFAGRIAAFSVQNRIAAVDGWAPFAREGNLMIYGPLLPDVYRRLAVYVDKILKGANPGDLPIELPTKVELVINLKTARALGLTIPQSLLVRADELIQ